jgi:hypothetical protein
MALNGRYSYVIHCHDVMPAMMMTASLQHHQHQVLERDYSSHPSDHHIMHRSSSSSKQVSQFILCKIVCVCAIILSSYHVGYYCGYEHGWIQGSSSSVRHRAIYSLPIVADESHDDDDEEEEEEEDLRRQEEASSFTPKILEEEAAAASAADERQSFEEGLKDEDSSLLFGSNESTRTFVAGMSLVDRDEFMEAFDVGVPKEPSTRQNSQVLLLHAQDALPDGHDVDDRRGITLRQEQLSVPHAVKHCDYVNVILTEPNRNNQCIAIVGQYK